MSQKKSLEIVVTKLLETELKPGGVIQAEVFENLFDLKRTDQAYQFLISRVRHALYEYGVYLSGEGLSETGCYEILDPRDHYWIAKLAVARAERDLAGKQVLLLNTKLDGFSDLQRRRHENCLRDLSHRLTAMQRAREVFGMLSSQQQKMLNGSDEEIS
jgi:hypothetical protein